MGSLRLNVCCMCPGQAKQRSGRTKAVKPKTTTMEHYKTLDLRSVEPTSDALQGCKVHFLDYGEHGKRAMEVMVKMLNGEVSLLTCLYTTGGCRLACLVLDAHRPAVCQIVEPCWPDLPLDDAKALMNALLISSPAAQ